MAKGIKQKMLAYHIARRDEIGEQINRTGEGMTVSVTLKRQRDFHAEAVEFLSQGG